MAMASVGYDQPPQTGLKKFMKKNTETFPSMIELAMMRGEVDHLEEEIDAARKAYSLDRQHLTEKFLARACSMFEEATGLEDCSISGSLIDYNGSLNKGIEFEIGKFEVYIPSDLSLLSDIEGIRFGLKGYSARVDYTDVLMLRSLAEQCLPHLGVFRMLVKEGARVVGEIQALRHKMEKYKERKHAAIRRQQEEIRDKQMNILISGERLHFSDSYGHAIYTRSHRSESYRWIEFTRIDIRRKTVDIRGLILEEEKRKGDHFYRRTGKDVLFERKGVRLETLGRTLFS
jgi:hypothetical protein